MSAKIITEFIHPPVPFRCCDWSACYDGYEPGHPIGTGATEAEAIENLIEQTNQQRKDLTP